MPHPVTGREVLTPQQVDQEKGALKDRVDNAISSADANIDALKKMESNDKGATQKRDKDMRKSLSDRRDGLKGDLAKIDAAAPADWTNVRSGVEANLVKAETEIDVTHVPPSTGAANKQPPSNP